MKYTRWRCDDCTRERVYMTENHEEDVEPLCTDGITPMMLKETVFVCRDCRGDHNDCGIPVKKTTITSGLI